MFCDLSRVIGGARIRPLDDETKAAFDSLAQQLNKVQETLEIVRDQRQQEKYKKAFQKAPEITFEEVQSWKTGDLRTLLEETPFAWYSGHPYRVIVYKHDRLEDGETEYSKRAHGFYQLCNRLTGETEEEWRKFGFDVFTDSCITDGEGGIKYLPADWDS
jgi:hypothetical protein